MKQIFFIATDPISVFLNNIKDSLLGWVQIAGVIGFLIGTVLCILAMRHNDPQQRGTGYKFGGIGIALFLFSSFFNNFLDFIKSMTK